MLNQQDLYEKTLLGGNFCHPAYKYLNFQAAHLDVSGLKIGFFTNFIKLFFISGIYFVPRPFLIISKVT